MATLGERLTRQWPDVLNALLGLWLIVSPWLLAYSGEATAAWNAWVPGVIIAVAALAALFSFHEWEEWVNGLLGVWLVISPWLLGYSALAAATWNHVVVGAIAAILAFFEIYQQRRHPAEARS